MSVVRFRLHAAGVLAPGLSSFADLESLDLGSLNKADLLPLELPRSERLPPNEQRRAPTVVRLTLACIEQLVGKGDYDLSTVRAIFATDDGIGEISTQMLEAISTTQQVSPLVFPSSVHGVAAGYFSIGFQNRKSATTVSQGADSFSAGLLTAVTEAAMLNEYVLFVAYDVPMTSPMNEVLPITHPTATAWVISPCADEFGEGVADFQLLLSVKGELPSNHLAYPKWMPRQWVANSSVHGIAILGLLCAASKKDHLMELGDCSLLVQLGLKGSCNDG